MTSDGAIAREAATVFPRYFDWAGACAYLSVSRDQLYRWVRAGMPASKIGRGPRARMRFDRLRLDAWMADQAITDGHVEKVVRRVA